MGLETTISKLEDNYKLSFKNAEPYGSLTDKTFNININKDDLMSFYKKLTDYIKEDYKLENNS
jgi:hypothetical protein